jgi:hypothetical protein
MKISHSILIFLIGAVFSISIPAASLDDATESPDMPMMNQGGSMMMNPQMMQQMMSQMPHMGYGQNYGMPMMGQGPGNMTMNPQMMHQMPPMGYGHGMPMMGQGMGNMMMNPQMMQMRVQHMQKMEKYMANIESLLAQILEAQKSK